MKITKLTENKLLIEYPSRKEMTLSNFRISEFKEGKDGIKGIRFSPDQFIDVYSDDKGNIDYWSYWEGFNYSKQELIDFVFIFYDELTLREQQILKASHLIGNDGYIICMEEGDEVTLKHETAHGYFYENKGYKKFATEIVNSLPEDIFFTYKQYLLDMGYIDEIIIDEMHAYLVTYEEEEWEECFETLTNNEIILDKSKQLNELFDKTHK